MSVFKRALAICAVGLSTATLVLSENPNHEIQFGFKEAWDVDGRTALVFYLNPKGWMFGVAGAAVCNGQDATWYTDSYSLAMNVDNEWIPVEPIRQGKGHTRVYLYYHAAAREESTLSFSGEKIRSEILAMCNAKNIQEAELRVRLRLRTKNILIDENTLSAGPIIESDWIGFAVRDGKVFLTSYWDSSGFRGLDSLNGFDEENVVTLSPSVELKPGDR